jgi:hypothetical protein
MRLKIVACSVFLFALCSSSAQQRPHVTGFFTDMHYIEGAGDVLGTEVWIVYARGGYWATVQMAEGSPDPPVVVPAQVSGSTVKFTVRDALIDQDHKPAPDLVLQFEGTITRTGFSGSINDNPFNLKRRNSYWQ